MSEVQIQELLAFMESYAEEVRKDPQVGLDLLEECGIIDSEGAFCEPYRNLQIPRLGAE